MVLPVEGDLSVRPGRELWISNQAVSVVHIKASSLQELSFLFELDENFASKDGVYHVGRTDILVSRVPILVVIFVFVSVSILYPIFLDGISLSGPLCVDGFEDTTFFHRVVGLGMELARSFSVLL